MINNNILIKSLTTFNQREYLEKCDLVNKYLIINIYEIPEYSSVSIKYTASSLFLDKTINKFQVILFFYFMVAYLPIVLYKEEYNKNISLKLKLTDNQKINILLENLMLENVVTLKKRSKKSFFLHKFNNHKKQVNFKLIFSIQKLNINSELNLIFNDLYINNLERILLSVDFNLNRNLYARLLGSSKEDFLRNLFYFWSF